MAVEVENMGKPVILCVDDEILILQSLKNQLEFEFGSDYSIEICESGEEALELMEEFTNEGTEVPLIITDYIMPEMYGDELLKSISIRYPHTVGILLTGQASLSGIKNAVNDSNLLRYIAKPWEKETMYTYIKDCLIHHYKKIREQAKREKLEKINAELNRNIYEKMDQIRQYNSDKSGKKTSHEIWVELVNSIRTIKAGIEVVRNYRCKIQDDDKTGIENYVNNVDIFCSAASETINSLIASFDDNLGYFSEAGSINSTGRKINQYKYEDANSDEVACCEGVNTQRVIKKLDKIVAWDEEDMILFNTNEVLFFSTESSTTIVMTKNGKYKVKEKLDVLENKLEKYNFYRCHRCYLVNLNYIRKIKSWIGDNSHFLNIGSHEIPVSRNKIKDMKSIIGIY